MNTRLALLPLAFATTLAFAADPAPAASPAPAPAPASTAAPAAETPAVLDTVETTAAQRQERAFRSVQLGMERVRSARAEDADTIVCLKQKPTGSNIAVINCATNRYWEKIRANSLADGVGSVGGAAAGGGGGSTSKEDKVLTLSLADYAALEKRYGKLPKAERAKP